MNNKGVTLIEVLLYMTIVSIFLSALIPFAWNIIGGSAKSSAQQEVSSNARYISERIKYEIRNAKEIVSVTSTTLTLEVEDTNKNPTVITYSNPNVTIQLGAQSVVNLNSLDTKITDFAFTDYTSLDNKSKNVQFTFTIDDNYGSTRQEFDVPEFFIQSAAEVRSN